MWRVLGRWLLYSTVGIILLLLASAGGGDLGSDTVKGSWTSILLSFAGVLAALTGIAVILMHRATGTFGDLWALAAFGAWFAGAGFVIAAWVSIARDLKNEGAANR